MTTTTINNATIKELVISEIASLKGKRLPGSGKANDRRNQIWLAILPELKAKMAAITAPVLTDEATGQAIDIVDTETLTSLTKEDTTMKMNNTTNATVNAAEEKKVISGWSWKATKANCLAEIAETFKLKEQKVESTEFKKISAAVRSYVGKNIGKDVNVVSVTPVGVNKANAVLVILQYQNRCWGITGNLLNSGKWYNVFKAYAKNADGTIIRNDKGMVKLVDQEPVVVTALPSDLKRRAKEARQTTEQQSVQVQTPQHRNLIPDFIAKRGNKETAPVAPAQGTIVVNNGETPF